MSDVSAILSLPYLQPTQAQKYVTHNEALRRLDLAVQLAVANCDRSRAARHSTTATLSSPATGPGQVAI